MNRSIKVRTLFLPDVGMDPSDYSTEDLICIIGDVNGR